MVPALWIIMSTTVILPRPSTAQTCYQELMLNDFNRDALSHPVSFSTVGEMYGDDDTISRNGTFKLENGQLLVRAASSPSYWFMEFEPHCIVPNPERGNVESSNEAYTRFSSFSHIQFDLEATVKRDVSIMLSGGNFDECDRGIFQDSRIQLSSVFKHDGGRQTLTIALSRWKTAKFNPSLGIHAIAFEFPANAGEFCFDNFRLCNNVAPKSPNPKVTDRMKSRTTPKPELNRNKAQKAPNRDPLKIPSPAAPMDNVVVPSSNNSLPTNKTNSADTTSNSQIVVPPMENVVIKNPTTGYIGDIIAKDSKKQVEGYSNASAMIWLPCVHWIIFVYISVFY